MENKLNLGCGKDIKKGWINLDILNYYGVDVVHDINELPLPFKVDTFDEIMGISVLEHADNPIALLKELIRISKDGALITISVPHANAYENLTDLQHKTNFTENSFEEGLLEEYDLKELKLTGRYFVWSKKNWWRRAMPFKSFFKIFFNGIYETLGFKFRVNKEIKDEK